MLFIVKSLRKISGIKKHIGWLLAELLIVFVGVYAAAMLANYKENKQNQERKRQIMAALTESLSQDEKGLAEMVKWWKEIGKPTLELHEQGKLIEVMPQLRADVNLYMAYSTANWEAILQSGIALLDVELIKEMEKLQESNLAVEKVLDRLLRLIDSVLIPNADKGTEEFYDRQTKKLRRKYEWFVLLGGQFFELVEEVHGQTVHVQEMLNASKDYR